VTLHQQSPEEASLNHHHALRTALLYGLALTASNLAACETSKEVGSACKNGVCPQANAQSTPPCLVSTTDLEIAWAGDAGVVEPAPPICFPVAPSAEGTVNCNVYFAFDDLVLASGGKLTGCQDLPFLESADKWAPKSSSLAHLCRVKQVPAPGGQPTAGADGWYYDPRMMKQCASGTPGAFRFTDGAQPPQGVTIHAVCVEGQTTGQTGLAALSASQCSLAADSARHASAVGDACLPETTPTAGYDDREVYVETGSAQCETGACLVFHLRGDPSLVCKTAAPQSMELGSSLCADPQEVKDRIYCSCRCDAPAGQHGSLCKCANGFSCVPALQGPSAVAGSYCVRNGTFAP
jgi:hypothetical protein